MPIVDGVSPVINIVSPAVASIYLNNTTTNIVATANDFETGVTRMIIYVTPPGGTRTAVQTVNFPASPGTLRTISVSYAFNTLGVYVITAEAIDKSRNNGAVIWTVTRTSSSTTTTTSSSTTAFNCSSLPSSKILVAPAPWSQGNEGSCSAHAVALVSTITRYYEVSQTPYSNLNMMSPEFLTDYYRSDFRTQEIINNGGTTNTYLTNCDCGCGTSIIGNGAVHINHGCCNWATLPYDEFPQGCQIPIFQAGINGSQCNGCVITQSVMDAAANFKIKAIGIAYPTDLCLLKRLIANGHALAFAITLNSNITYAPSDPNFIYSTDAGGYGMATHAMVVIGYDDSKQAFLIQNSWGLNWANNGRVWMSYSHFAAKANYGFYVTWRPDQNLFPII